MQLNVGYSVHPKPIPSSMYRLVSKNRTPRKYVQKLKLFILENRRSGIPKNTGRK
jgi:hypothetical protein